MIDPAPRLWSDFDGTAVAIARKTNPRNWSKYPLPGLAGYVDFLRGVQTSGVEVAGVVSRRPDILVRRLATTRSIVRLGFLEFFGNSSQIVLAGSEEAKGRFIAEQSKNAPIGMLEDKPHALGKVLIGVMQGSDYPIFPHHPITLGVVNHPKSQEYIERLAEHAAGLEAVGVSTREVPSNAGLGFSLRSESLSIDVVQLEPYTELAGKAFGQRLLETKI